MPRAASMRRSARASDRRAAPAFGRGPQQRPAAPARSNRRLTTARRTVRCNRRLTTTPDDGPPRQQWPCHSEELRLAGRRGIRRLADGPDRVLRITSFVSILFTFPLALVRQTPRQAVAKRLPIRAPSPDRHCEAGAALDSGEPRGAPEAGGPQVQAPDRGAGGGAGATTGCTGDHAEAARAPRTNPTGAGPPGRSGRSGTLARAPSGRSRDARCRGQSTGSAERRSAGRRRQRPCHSERIERVGVRAPGRGHRIPGQGVRGRAGRFLLGRQEEAPRHDRLRRRSAG
jgi:hypothetical protein